MATDATLGYGTVVKLNDTGSMVAIGQVKDITMPELETADVDVTNHDSPGRTKEYIGGLKDGADFDLELVYKKAMHKRLHDLLGQNWDCEIVYPDGSKHEFNVLVKKVGGTAPVEEAMMTNVTMKVAGAVTFTEGA